MSNGIIKPCPHCGGGASLYDNYSRRYRSYFVFVKCDICGSQGKTYRSEIDPEEIDWNNDACEDAIRAWNMRDHSTEGAQP